MKSTRASVACGWLMSTDRSVEASEDEFIFTCNFFLKTVEPRFVCINFPPSHPIHPTHLPIRSIRSSPVVLSNHDSPHSHKAWPFLQMGLKFRNKCEPKRFSIPPPPSPSPCQRLVDKNQQLHRGLCNSILLSSFSFSSHLA